MGDAEGDTSQTGRSCCFSQTGCPSGRISYHSGGSWMVFHQCEAFHALSGCPSRWISCHSWIVISRAFIKWLHFSTWLNFLDWISDLMVILGLFEYINNEIFRNVWNFLSSSRKTQKNHQDLTLLKSLQMRRLLGQMNLFLKLYWLYLRLCRLLSCLLRFWTAALDWEGLDPIIQTYH